MVIGLLLVLPLAACTKQNAESPPPAARSGDDAPPAREPDGGHDTTTAPGGDFVATETGMGPIRIGMTVAEAEAALGDTLAPLGPAEPYCHHLVAETWPKGISIMVTEGTIARFNVDNPSVPTAAGARVGDSEERIRSLYPGGVEETPHKYTDGNYLIVTPSSAGHQIVFETDGTTVVRYRAGRLPEVGWVEGCS